MRSSPAAASANSVRSVLFMRDLPDAEITYTLGIIHRYTT